MTEVKSRIVEAVGISANGTPGNPLGKRLAKVIELAMAEAVIECSDAGVTDPAEIRNRMQFRREKAKAEFYLAALTPEEKPNGNDQ